MQDQAEQYRAECDTVLLARGKKQPVPVDTAGKTVAEIAEELAALAKAAQ